MPHWPCLANGNLGPSSLALGLMNAARYPLISSAGGTVPLNLLSWGL